MHCTEFNVYLPHWIDAKCPRIAETLIKFQSTLDIGYGYGVNLKVAKHFDGALKSNRCVFYYCRSCVTYRRDMKASNGIANFLTCRFYKHRISSFKLKRPVFRVRVYVGLE